jgi:hypothetical protein
MLVACVMNILYHMDVAKIGRGVVAKNGLLQEGNGGLLYFEANPNSSFATLAS